MCVLPPLSGGLLRWGGGGGVEPLTKFLKKGGLTGSQILERGAGKERRGVNFFRGEGLQVLLKK